VGENVRTLRVSVAVNVVAVIEVLSVSLTVPVTVYDRVGVREFGVPVFVYVGDTEIER